MVYLAIQELQVSKWLDYLGIGRKSHFESLDTDQGDTFNNFEMLITNNYEDGTAYLLFHEANSDDTKSDTDSQNNVSCRLKETKTISNQSIALSDCFLLSNESPLRSPHSKSEKVVSFSVTPLSTAIAQPTPTTDGSEGIKSTRTKRKRSLPPIITPSTKIRVDSPIVTCSQS